MRVQKAGDRVIGDEVGHLLRRLWSFGTEPVRGPVQRAEESARGDGRVGRAQHAAPDPAGDDRAHAALVAIALVDDACAQAGRQRVDLHVRRRSLDFVHEAQDVRHRHRAQARGERRRFAARAGQRVEQPIERAVLAEEEQLVLAAEVVIEVAWRQISGDGDVAHAGRREAAGAEHAGGGAHDLHAARVGAFQTAVRKVNHGSILTDRHVVVIRNSLRAGALAPRRPIIERCGP